MLESSTTIPEAPDTSARVVVIVVEAPAAKQATRAAEGIAWRNPAPPSWQARRPLHQRCAAVRQTSTPPLEPEQAGCAAISSAIGTGSKMVTRKSSSLLPSQSSSASLQVSGRTGGAVQPTQPPALQVSV